PATTWLCPLSLHDALPISADGAMEGDVEFRRSQLSVVDPESGAAGGRQTEHGREPLRDSFGIDRHGSVLDFANLQCTSPCFFWLDRKSTRLNSSHVSISYA